MTNAENFAPTHSMSDGSAIQNTATRIATYFRERAEARRTEKAVRHLSDHLKRDIGWIGDPDQNSVSGTEFRHIKSLYAW